MADSLYVGQKLTAFEDNGKIRPVSRVTLVIDDDNTVTAGDDTGYEIVANCAYATQEMADAILAQMKGYEYQMYTADAARLDPAAELGDGVTASGVYGVLSRLSDDGGGYPDITAPGEAEMENEFPVGSGPMTKAFERKFKDTYSRITKTAEEIRLEVVKEVEGLTSSFDVKLDEIRGEVTDAVNGLSSSVDVKLGEITAQVTGLGGRVGKVELTADGLTTTVNSLNGAFSKVEQTVNGWTYTDPDGTTKVKGSSIETGSLVLTGSITWSDLNSSVQSSINNRGISEGTARSIASTEITSTLVSSPTIRGASIEGAQFWNLSRTHRMEMGDSDDGTNYGVFRLYNDVYSRTPYFSIYDDELGSVSLMAAGEGFLSVFALSAGRTATPKGRWDFSDATIVNFTPKFT